MNEDLISIIVPVYNAQRYVHDTVCSILAQTYTNIEVICVDDGSTDESYSELQALAAADARVKIYKQANRGVTQARGFGFEQSKGEYIGFVDADDRIEPDMYERLYGNLKKYGADISHCGHDVRFLDGRIVPYYNTGRLVKQDKITGLKDLLSGSYIEPGLCNKLYKRSLLHSLLHSGVMDPSIKINEDLLMNYYLFKQADSAIYEDICLYHYIKREGSASAAKLNKHHIWDPIRVKEIILKDSIGTDWETTARRVSLFTCINQYNRLLKAGGTAYEADKAELRKWIISKKDDIKYLKIKHALGARMISSTPQLYCILYKHFS